MLGATTEARWGEGPLHTLLAASAASWPGFAAELEEDSGAGVGLRMDGTLAVALGPDDYAALHEAVDVQRRLGCQVEMLTSRECRQLEPALNPRVVGGAFYGADHQVDNRAVLRALTEALRRRGVEVRPRAVRRLQTSGGGRPVTGVVLDDASVVGAEQVVLAAGCRSGQVEGLAPVDVPPVRPVKGQILRLRTRPGYPPLARTVRAAAEGRDIYLVPRAGGEIVVGATVEEAGFDTTVTAGAVYDLLRRAVAAVPDTAEMELVEAIARLRPGSPDNGPVLGTTTSTGLLVATGHYRHGVLLTPATVDAMAEVLAGRPLPAPAAPFGAQRFGVGVPAYG
jgi:glycine oxidase